MRKAVQGIDKHREIERSPLEVQPGAGRMLLLGNSDELHVVMFEVRFEFFLPDRQDTAAARSPGGELEQDDFLSAVIRQGLGRSVKTGKVKVGIHVSRVRAHVRWFLTANRADRQQNNEEQREPDPFGPVNVQRVPPFG